MSNDNCGCDSVAKEPDKVFHIGADDTIEYGPAQVKNQATQELELVENGTCTYTIKNRSDLSVFQGLENVVMPYVGGGRHVGTLDKSKTALMTEGQKFYVFVNFTAPVSIDDGRRIPAVAMYRGSV